MARMSNIGAGTVKCACALSLAVSMTSAGFTAEALAQEAADGAASVLTAGGTVECNNGWKLGYDVVDSKVRITGVAATGSGTLTVPDAVDGLPVVIIGAKAFEDCKALTSIELPGTVELFKSEAFCGSGLTKFSVPSSVKAVSYRCFKSCTALGSITFEGDSLLYLGQEAFMYCSSLKELAIPALTSHPIARSDADSVASAGVELAADSCAIGKSCFAQCKALETITFEGGVGHDTPDYFLDVSCLNGADNVKTFIWKCKSDSVGSGQAGQKVLAILESYYSLDFYNSEADAKAGTNKVATATYKPKDSADEVNVVKTLDLLKNSSAYARYKLSGSGSIPACPSGKVWGVADHGVQGAWDTLDDSYQVVAVSRDNLDYGWVSSPAIDEYNADVEASSAKGGMYDSNLPVVRMEAGGKIPDIEDGLKVYAADGTQISGSNIKLVFEQAKLVLSGTGQSYNVKSWHSVSKVSGAGRYRVHAVNTANNTETATVTFEVKPYEPTVHAYAGFSQAEMLGALSSDAASALGAVPEYNVVASASDWRTQLLGAGLAGASGGVLLFDDKDNASRNAFHAHVASKSSSVQIVGSASLVPQSTNTASAKYLSDWLLSSISGNQTRYRDDSTPQALSAQVYNGLSQGYWGSTWGKTAVIVSGSQARKALPVAQLAYQEKAPVFFADDGGNLSASDMATLAAGGFERIVVAGDEQGVSASAVAAIAEQAGVTPERVLGSSASACENSIDFAKQMIAAGNSAQCVAIADGTSAANVVQAATIAAQNGGIALVCNSARDVKKVEGYLSGIVSASGGSSVGEIYYCGSFKQIDSKVRQRIESVFTTPLSTKDASGDSIEAEDGSAYVATSGSAAKLVRRSDAGSTDASVGSVKLGSKTYKVTAVGKDAFASSTTSITLGSSVKTIAASAFGSCSRLSTLTIKSTKLTAKTVAAKAFAGLPGKVTVKVPKSKVKAYKKLFAKKGLSKKATVKKW